MGKSITALFALVLMAVFVLAVLPAIGAVNIGTAIGFLEGRGYVVGAGNEYVRRDGTQNMTGSLDFNGQSIRLDAGGSGARVQDGGAQVVAFRDSTNARGINFTLTAAGNQTVAASAGTLILTSSLITISTTAGNLSITPVAGSAIVLDGTINVDAGIITGATSITSTAFVGALTGTASGNLVSGGALGTPSSGTGTNITGVPAANILAGSFGAGAYVISTSLRAATIELGHATDTTLARVSAGVVSIENSKIVKENSATVAFQQGTDITTSTDDLTLGPAGGLVLLDDKWFKMGGGGPVAGDCDFAMEGGRLWVDNDNGKFYICDQKGASTGWKVVYDFSG